VLVHSSTDSTLLNNHSPSSLQCRKHPIQLAVGSIRFQSNSTTLASGIEAGSMDFNSQFLSSYLLIE
jgi:hypothetical protein